LHTACVTPASVFVTIFSSQWSFKIAPLLSLESIKESCKIEKKTFFLSVVSFDVLHNTDASEGNLWYLSYKVMYLRFASFFFFFFFFLN
jgi:hypothetical protein